MQQVYCDKATVHNVKAIKRGHMVYWGVILGSHGCHGLGHKRREQTLQLVAVDP